MEHSCTDSTHVRRICTYCGKTELVEKALEEDEEAVHQYDTTVVAPTATELGYTLRHCAKCGQDYQTDPTEPQEPVHESKTYSGVGAPSNSLGQDGDIYIDLLTATIYVKSNGSWSVVGGKQEDPTVNIITSEGIYIYTDFDEGVPEADRQIIKNEINNTQVTGLNDSIRLDFQKNILQKCFPELWDKVSMDSFLTDETNKVTIRRQLYISVASSNLSDPNEPFIEYSFVPKMLMWITSPVYGNYSAEYRLTSEDFELIDADITITAPVCGDFNVTAIKHNNAETGEVYQIFTENGQNRFTYDKENNTVSLTVKHFSNIRIEGKGSQSTSTEAQNQNVSPAPKTSDVPYGIMFAATLVIAALAFANASKRRNKRG